MSAAHTTGPLLPMHLAPVVNEVLPLVAPRRPRYELVRASDGAVLSAAPVQDACLRTARVIWGAVLVEAGEGGEGGEMVLRGEGGEEVGRVRPCRGPKEKL